MHIYFSFSFILLFFFILNQKSVDCFENNTNFSSKNDTKKLFLKGNFLDIGGFGGEYINLYSDDDLNWEITVYYHEKFLNGVNTCNSLVGILYKGGLYPNGYLCGSDKGVEYKFENKNDNFEWLFIETSTTIRCNGKCLVLHGFNIYTDKNDLREKLNGVNNKNSIFYKNKFQILSMNCGTHVDNISLYIEKFE